MPKPPEPPEPPIHAAARIGDVAGLAELVKAGYDVNARADLEVDNGSHLRQLTPLMVAARSIDGATIETLQWLLDHGADLQARSEGGETAAWYAAGKGGRWDFHDWQVVPDHADRLALLLNAGLDRHETNFVGRSLLIEACAAGDPARVCLLLNLGVPADGVQNPDQSKSRASRMQVHLARELAAQGMTPDQVDRMLLTLTPANPEGRDSSSIPLFAAAASGSAECVQLLLTAGANAAELDDRGRLALMYAASPSVAEALIAAGTDARARTPDGYDVLDVILDGASCCSGLCGSGRFDVARVLLAHGASLDESGSRFGNTRLYAAAFRHADDVVAFLIGLGRRATEADVQGRTALHAICWQGEYQDSNVNTRCEQIIRRLAKAGADLNARDAFGQTPLHEAAEGDWGNQTAIRTLLALGADPDPSNAVGQTPLMNAASRGEINCIRMLLAAGASPDRRNEDGLNARDFARRHLDSWRQINAAGVQDPNLGPPDEVRTRHAQALRDAEESYSLLLDPAAPTA